MGTRINVLMAHSLADWSNRETSLEVLSTTLPKARSLARYWMEDKSQPIPEDRWIAHPAFPTPETRDYNRYSGPGSLFVEINPHCIHICTGARWRGFLSIQPLRAIHIDAFNAIATAFNVHTFRCFPDDDFVIGGFWDGANFNTCCRMLDDRYGDALQLTEHVDPVIATQTDAGCPMLQYVRALPIAANNPTARSGGSAAS